jgi:hypothetical protein
MAAHFACVHRAKNVKFSLQTRNPSCLHSSAVRRPAR